MSEAISRRTLLSGAIATAAISALPALPAPFEEIVWRAARAVYRQRMTITFHADGTETVVFGELEGPL